MSLLSYLLFLLLALFVFRIPSRSKTPNTSLCKLHLKLAVVFVPIWLFVDVKIAGELSIYDAIIALFLYFAVHYAMFMQVFALITRSVSAQMIFDLSKANGSSNIDEFQRGQGGSSFEDIKQDRFFQMQKFGIAKISNDEIELTLFGRCFAFTTKTMLRLWGLHQLSESREHD